MKYWTFTEPSEKSVIFVLHGYFKAETNEVLENINNEGIPATRVTILSEKFDKTIYLVHFDKNKVNFNSLVHQNKSIGQLIIKWSKFDKNLKSPTLGHRCQGWGHTARNCGRDFRCVKCTSSHAPGREHCERKTKEGSAKCVNFNGDHQANSRQCTVFLQYQSKISRRSPPVRNKFVSTLAPWANGNKSQQHYYEHFPSLPQRQICQNENPNYNAEYQQKHEDTNQNVSFTKPTSFHQTNFPKVLRDNSNSNFANLQSAFLSIPEIGHTLELFGELTRELANCMDHGQRLSIMMRYCTPRPIQNVT